MWHADRKSFGAGRHHRGRFLKQLFLGCVSCGSRTQFAGIILVLVTWILLVLSCGDIFDGDCWMGERVHLVEKSRLGEHYDPEVARKTIFVYDFAGVRSLKFGSLSSARQSTAVLGDPDLFTMPIACHMAAAIIVMCPSPPSRVLIFGMGGGMLVAFIQKHFPNAYVQVVDLEPEVVRLAMVHFNVRAGPLLNVTISDGRKWVSALPPAGLPDDQRYDLIIQDACAGHPCTLVTLQSYAALKSLALSSSGIFIQNLFSPSPRVVRTMQEVFSPLYFLDSAFSSKVVIGAAPQQHDPTASSGNPADMSAADAVGRARFLRDLGITPRCFVHGLRRGQTDDAVSMFERRFSPAGWPRLAAPPILDDDPDVVALERARWTGGGSR